MTQSIIPTQKSHLMDLPAELRNRIYELALPEHTILASGHNTKNQYAVSITEPPLLLASKQIRAEARQMFYSQNTFQAMFTFQLIQFLNLIDGERLRMLRSVRPNWIFVTLGNAKNALRRLNARRCEGLRHDAVKMQFEFQHEGGLETACEDFEGIEEYETDLASPSGHGIKKKKN